MQLLGQISMQFDTEEYLRLQEHCNSLKSWAMYQHVAHRVTFASVAETLNSVFRIAGLRP